MLWVEGAKRLHGAQSKREVQDIAVLERLDVHADVEGGAGEDGSSEGAA